MMTFPGLRRESWIRQMTGYAVGDVCFNVADKRGFGDVRRRIAIWVGKRMCITAPTALNSCLLWLPEG